MKVGVGYSPVFAHTKCPLALCSGSLAVERVYQPLRRVTRSNCNTSVTLLSGRVRRECTFFGASSRCERGHFDDQYRRQGDEQRPTSDHAVSQSDFPLGSYPLLTVMRHPFRARGNAVINSVPPAPGAISHKTPDCYASPQCKDRRARDRQWLWSIEGLCR
jgi:hypothetical protein